MKSKTYFVMALDPIHIGTGGYRLERVDNTIVREPGTSLPKIPGTTIEGNTRTYVYYQEKRNNSAIKEACAVGKKINSDEPCGKCPICITFGFTRDDKSLHGMAQFTDARILFFPVHSMIGPVWITCPSILKEINGNELKFEDNSVEIKGPQNKEEIVISKQIKKRHDRLEKLNLGWLYLDLNRDINNFVNAPKFKDVINKEILERVVVVHNDIFEKSVNSNLEVRTSVSIDPSTGAAEEGALFTYEAIPRATIFWFDLVVNDPSNFNMPNSKIKNTKHVIDEVKKAFPYFETLGVGGMQTRGFGRLRILNGGSNGSK